MNISKEKAIQIEEQDRRIEEKLEKIKNRIVVFSGKGGVGKTTVAVNLSYSMVLQELQVGLLDADITGPNVPKMIGLNNSPFVRQDERGLVPHKINGLYVMSIAPMISKDAPVIWRGPMRSGAITQFLADVSWGDLDFLIADLPPGTGDEVITVAQKMKPQMAIVVTTPQEISIIDCRRAVNMAKKLDIQKIGIIENMSGQLCPHCGKVIDLFGTGGGEKMAEEMEVKYLGNIPIEADLRKSADLGESLILDKSSNGVAKTFKTIAKEVRDYV